MLTYHLRGKDISQVLAMPVTQAQEFFTEKPVVQMLGALADVGLGYIGLGQVLTTLSGGERQRLGDTVCRHARRLPLHRVFQQAFGGVDRGKVPNEDGTIAHAEVLVGDSVIMTFDAQDHWPVTPSFLMLYVPDCDQTHQAALDAGATTVTPLATNAWAAIEAAASATHWATSGGSRPTWRTCPRTRWSAVCLRSPINTIWLFPRKRLKRQ